MAATLEGSAAYVEQARAFQARRAEYAARGDLDGLVRDLYTEDARLDTFEFHREGRPAVRNVIELVMERSRGLGPARDERFAAGRDFIWQELAFDGPNGEIRPYEVKLLREGQVYLHLYGSKQGSLWRPAEFAGETLPDTTAARALHRRYVEYHIRGDADGLVDEFFTEDARLVTPNVAVEGREALRSVFRELFAKEQDFRPLSVDRITTGPDYVWFEATVSSSLGRRSLYDVQMLRNGQVCLQLVGRLAGAMPTEAAGIRR